MPHHCILDSFLCGQGFEFNPEMMVKHFSEAFISDPNDSHWI